MGVCWKQIRIFSPELDLPQSDCQISASLIAIFSEYSVREGGKQGLSHLALMRYSARPMLAGEPVIVTWRSVDPSTGLAILIWAPDICLISLILAPWRPMMQPMSCVRGEMFKRLKIKFQLLCDHAHSPNNRKLSLIKVKCLVHSTDSRLQFWRYSQKHSSSVYWMIHCLAKTLTSFGMAISWEQGWAEASIPNKIKIKYKTDIYLSKYAKKCS